MRLLHLFWPHLPLRLARRRLAPQGSGSFPMGPIVLGGQPWTDGTVLDMSPPARTMGIRRGMPLGSAHRLAPEAVFLDPDPRRDAETLEEALECLGRFSPGIAGVVDSADPAFGLIELQVDGLERLWGPEPMLLARIDEALAPILPGRARAGVAGTKFAATIAAATSIDTAADASMARPAARSVAELGPAPAGTSVARPRATSAVRPTARSAAMPAAAPGRELVSVPPDGDALFLAPMPAGLLTPDLDVRARLARFGLEHIGSVGALPRSALIARFGDEGARMHARANGEELVPFRPRRAPERLRLALPIEPGVEDLEPLRFVFRRLVAALADQLLARGVAASTAHLLLELDPAFAPRGTPSSLAFEQRLPESTAEAEAIERLLYAQLERTPPPAPVIRLDLELADVGPAAGQQLPLFVPQAVRAGRLNWQLARLALTFGEDRIRRVELTDPEAPLPETRWRWIPIESGAIVTARSGRR